MAASDTMVADHATDQAAASSRALQHGIYRNTHGTWYGWLWVLLLLLALSSYRTRTAVAERSWGPPLTPNAAPLFFGATPKS